MPQLFIYKILFPGAGIRALRAAWREWLDRVLDPYRPGLYYMRGPGPKWRAKNLVPVKVKVRSY
jgi:hypothetical protein